VLTSRHLKKPIKQPWYKVSTDAAPLHDNSEELLTSQHKKTIRNGAQSPIQADKAGTPPILMRSTDHCTKDRIRHEKVSQQVTTRAVTKN